MKTIMITLVSYYLISLLCLYKARSGVKGNLFSYLAMVVAMPVYLMDMLFIVILDFIATLIGGERVELKPCNFVFMTMMTAQADWLNRDE